MSGDRRYPKRPILGVGGVVLRDDEVLLVERGREPLKGFWSLPGGALEVGELAADAVRREVKEETGLDVRVEELVQVFERITQDDDNRPEYHYVLLDYLCTPTGGTLHAADDAARAAWVHRRRLNEYQLTEGAIPVIEKAFQLRDSDNHEN